MTTKTIELYIDYKSPYAYLAVAPAWELERDFDVKLDWMPYTLDIPDFLGYDPALQRQRIAKSFRRRYRSRAKPYGAPVAAGEVLVHGCAALR